MIYFIFYLIGCYLSIATYVSVVNNMRSILISQKPNEQKIEFYKEKPITIIVMILFSWLSFLLNLGTNYLYKSQYDEIKIEIINWGCVLKHRLP